MIIQNNFNLGINFTQSNGPLLTSQIVSHFVSHFITWNEKVQIDYLVMLANPNWFVHIDKVIFFYACHFGYFD
jgi:hypothetical protein